MATLHVLIAGAGISGPVSAQGIPYQAPERGVPRDQRVGGGGPRREPAQEVWA